jgi:hypothetical protein
MTASGRPGIRHSTERASLMHEAAHVHRGKPRAEDAVKAETH